MACLDSPPDPLDDTLGTPDSGWVQHDRVYIQGWHFGLGDDAKRQSQRFAIGQRLDQFGIKHELRRSIVNPVQAPLTAGGFEIRDFKCVFRLHSQVNAAEQFRAGNHASCCHEK